MPPASSKPCMDVDQWLTANTCYCVRYQARLSVTACKQNRSLSGGDCRCEGCGGLNEQPPPTPRLRLLPSTCHEYEAAPEPEGFRDNQDDSEAGQDDLSFLNDHEIELADEQLEALYPGLSKEIGELLTEGTSLLDEQAHEDRRERTPRRRKVAVFMGRCHRCGEYMVNDRERQFSEKDEDVYRCYSCGWRISPVYAFNRANPARDRQTKGRKMDAEKTGRK